MPGLNGYIGRSPSDSAVTKARQIYNVTSDTSTFTFASGYDVGYFEVYINGAKQIETTDYTAGNGSTFTLTSAATSGDVIEAVAFKAFNLGQSQASSSSGDFTVGEDLTVTGDITFGGTITGDGSGLTGIANTFNISTDTLNVVGVSTFNSGLTTFTSQGVDVTGIVTATSFSGPLTGNVTGNVTGNADTASNLTGTPEVTVSTLTGVAGTFTGPLEVSDTTDSTSTTTGALIVSGGVGIAKSLFVGGNLSIGGTLTYEDVTNVDSLGIITARQGVHIGSPTGVAATLTATGGAVFTGVVTATEFVGDGSGLTEVPGRIGISSAGTLIGVTTALNFIGLGNTVVVNGSTIDVSIEGGGATGGGDDKVFQENQRVVNNDYTLTAGYSAMSVGPVSVAAGVTVTVPAGERWVIL